MEMKRIFALLLALCLLLSGCGGVAEPTETQPATEEPAETTAPTQAQEDPAADGVLTVLLIGNSFATGFPDELAGMLDAVDMEARIYSVYYPGCTTQKHWQWKQSAKANYRFRHHVQNGEDIDVGIVDSNDPLVIHNAVDLQYCLDAENWDVISLQQHFKPEITGNFEQARYATKDHADKMYDFLKQEFPQAKLVWYETWTYDVGWKNSAGSFGIEDGATQAAHQDIINRVSADIVTENGITMIPCGAAWSIARNEYDLGQLTRGDMYHDGEQGGQYLNACVWYESLTGLDCRENTWRPTYSSYEDAKFASLREIAHRAVEENTLK